MILLRPVCPETTETDDFGRWNNSARNSHKAAFAFPSTGGAVRAIFNAPPITPASAVREARGCTRHVMRVPFREEERKAWSSESESGILFRFRLFRRVLDFGFLVMSRRHSEEFPDLGGIERLFFQKGVGQFIQLIAMFGQDPGCGGLASITMRLTSRSISRAVSSLKDSFRVMSRPR